MFQRLSILFCLLLVVNTVLGDKKNKKQPEAIPKNDSINYYKRIGSPMPPIQFYTTDGKLVTETELQNKANLFIMMFSPTCDHCTNQTMALEDNLHLFRKSNIILVTLPAAKEGLLYFENTTHVSAYPKLKITLDSCHYVEKVNNYQSLPQINIYDHNRKLLRVFNGDIILDSLKKYIE